MLASSPADQYLPVLVPLMVLFVLGALAFILTGEFVRRWAIRHDPNRSTEAPPAQQPSPENHV